MCTQALERGPVSVGDWLAMRTVDSEDSEG